MLLDIALAVVLLSACSAIGAPLCLLLPAERFRARFMIAPLLGFGLHSIGGTVLYLWGVRPWVSMVAMATAGIVLAAVFVLRKAPLRKAPRSNSMMALGAATVAVILICLLPGWTGGPQFRIFQANVYDQMTYLAGAVTFPTLDHASMTAEANRAGADPVVAKAAWNLDNRGAVSIVHVAAAVIGQHDLIDSSHPFLAATQANMLFAAVFVLVNVFAAGYRLAFFLASALTVGFFQQYVLDINSWSQLSSQPVYLLLTAFAVLAFDDRRFGDGALAGIARFAAIFGVLAGSALYLYPESFAVYGFAGVAIVVLAVGLPTSRRARLFGLAALGSGACVAVLLGLFFWTGTLEYTLRQLTNAAANPPDWWRYFQRYLFGSEQNYLAVLTDPASSYRQVAAALFSLPVESAMAAFGLHFLLQPASWPAAIANVWKLVLYGFLAVLVIGAAGASARIWRADPAGNGARMIGACIGGCLAPVIILSTGHAWAAGKGLSMVTPLLFLLLITPLLAKPDVVSSGRAVRLASLAFAFAHLALGLLRPILVTEFAGAALPGLPTAAAQVNDQKAGLDWNLQRWTAEIRQCNGIIIEVDDPIMHQLVRRVAAGVGVPWASPGLTWPDRSRQPKFPEGWGNFGCVVTTSSTTAKPGQRLIWVAKDRSVLDYLGGKIAVLEIGTRSAPGVSARGVYGPEHYRDGKLRWTSQAAHFEVPNKPASPSRFLELELWPMSLSADALTITVNGETVYQGAIPSSAVTIALDRFVAQDRLSIELLTSALTRFPNDPREFGVAIKALRLGKAIAPR